MKVRFEGGPHHGGRDEMEDGTLARHHQGEPPYVYVQTFRRDEDGTQVFQYVTDAEDPLFERVMEHRDERIREMRRAEMERNEVAIALQFGPL